MAPSELTLLLLKALPWIFPAGTLAMTAYAYRRHRRWVDAPKQQVGATIIRVDIERDTDDNSPSYYPVYRFRTAQGQTIEAREMSNNYQRLKVGVELPIFYDENDPTQVSASDAGIPAWGWIVLALANAFFVWLAWFMSSSM